LAWFTLGVTFTSGIGLLDGQPVTAAFRLCFTNEKLFGQTWDLPIVVTTIDIVLVWATPPAVSPSMRREDRWMTTDGSFFWHNRSRHNHHIANDSLLWYYDIS
jgi:hypothetical protein